jgi:hypothetical protein
MAELETNLLNALQSVESSSGEKPCGCHDKAALGGEATDIFGSGQMGEASDLEAQLDAALGAALSGAEHDFAALDSLSFEEEMAFAQINEGTNLSLEDILALTEKYPGLKITFSY